MSLINIVKKYLFTESYNFVPRCPRCNSWQTGYIIEGHRNETNEQIKLDRMQHGEIVHIHEFVSSANNLFCEKCNAEWCGEIIKKRLTQEEIEQEKSRRGISDEYIFERNFTKKNLKKFKTHIKPCDENEEPGITKVKSKKNNKTKDNTKSEKSVKIKK